jgi:hypothetical protein
MFISRCLIKTNNPKARKKYTTGTIIGVKLIKLGELYEPSYHVQFDNGEESFWPVYNTDMNYLFLITNNQGSTEVVSKFDEEGLGRCLNQC